jgi:hypothetical protein
MSPVVKLGGDSCLTQRMDPLQAPVLRAAIIKVVENVNRLLHLRAEIGIMNLV